MNPNQPNLQQSKFQPKAVLAEANETAAIISDSVVSTVSQQGKVEKASGIANAKKFRVTNFAYQFKTGASTPLVAINGIYEPRSEAEKEFLVHQVSQGRIVLA